MAALWKSIYEQENVAPRTAEIAAESDGITFDLESYGKVQLLVKPASAVGDNFMSDTYYNTAVLSNGVQHRAFVKVAIILQLIPMDVPAKKLSRGDRTPEPENKRRKKNLIQKN